MGTEQVSWLRAERLGRDAHPHLVVLLGDLYNNAIDYLSTKPLRRNTHEQQIEWWNKLDHEKVTVHLYSPEQEPWNIAAFSMVQDRGKFCTPMFAINPLFWGRGYGKLIIMHYLEIADGKPLHGEQLVSNGAICHLNHKLGWIVQREENGVQYLYHPNGTDWPQSAYDEIVRYHLED